MIHLTCIPVKVQDCRFRRDFRTLRQRLGVRQREVAEGIGVSEAAFSRWERGEPSMGAWRERQAMEWLARHVEAR